MFKHVQTVLADPGIMSPQRGIDTVSIRIASGAEPFAIF